MSTAAIVAGTAASGITSGVLGYEGAQGQASAANNASQLQYELGQQDLAFQEAQWQQAQRNAQPWLQTGGSAEMEMAQLLGLPTNTNGLTPQNPFPSSTGTNQSFPGLPVPPGLPVKPNAGNGGSTFNMSNLLNHGMYSGTPWMGGGETAQLPNGGQPPRMVGSPLFNQGPRMLNRPVETGGGEGGPRSLPGNPAHNGRPVVGGGTPPNPNAGNLQPFAPWTKPFTAPTLEQAEQYPGYQFQMQQGQQALQNQFSASGQLLDPNEQRAMAGYAEGLAQNDYTNVYNQALGEYQQNYNIYQQNQSNQWNRLASLAGLGQTTAGQLNSAGLQTGSNVNSLLLGTGSQIGQNLQNSAAATASGYNAIGNSINSGVGNIGNYFLMSQLLGQQGGGSQTGMI